ncbi:MAG: hypothetical protein Q8L80_06115 [Gallionella sp.]|nr:hypothetical protein [Gallionella sp.]
MGYPEMTEEELQPIIDHIRESGVDPCSLFAPMPPPARWKRGQAKPAPDSTPRMDRPFRVFTPSGQVLNTHEYIHAIYMTKSVPRLARAMGGIA